jgi:hypothetical protein
VTGYRPGITASSTTVDYPIVYHIWFTILQNRANTPQIEANSGGSGPHFLGTDFAKAVFSNIFMTPNEGEIWGLPNMEPPPAELTKGTDYHTINLIVTSSTD